MPLWLIRLHSAKRSPRCRPGRQRSAKRFMFGIVSGVAATMFRQPFSTRAVLHYRRPGLLSRAELQATTTLDMNDPSIPREAREYLGESPDMIKPA